jgi:hypothetical protein
VNGVMGGGGGNDLSIPRNAAEEDVLINTVSVNFKTLWGYLVWQNQNPHCL